MPQHPHICMLAAENDVIPGAKVGGIGDVVRDIPKALARAGATVSVIIPAYNAFHALPGSSKIAEANVQFAGKEHSVALFELFVNRDPGVRYLVLHHPDFGACGAGEVYCDDPADRPFATDASKFALFCAGALQCLVNHALGEIDVLHLHDWHAGFAAVLREYDPAFVSLKSVRCVLSIHNLAMQGIRPFKGDVSSVESWYPNVAINTDMVADPRWHNCINPMAAAIRLVDKVHTVSPTYSVEIIHPNEPERGFHGGEGLERDLQQCANRNALVGITNGIEYGKVLEKMQWHTMMATIGDTLLSWLGENNSVSTTDYLAHQRTQQWLASNRPRHVFTSVGRLTEQKMALLLTPTENNSTALDDMLMSMRGKGVFILLGSGDKLLEEKCRRSASQHPNFLFLNRYAQSLSDMLFANGDVFLMPSSFEPCGISQMLAMRQGQPCIVHAVGGLRDTVVDMIDGFQFHGNSVAEQVTHFQDSIQKVISLREQQPELFRTIAANASEKRFLWQDSAEQYLSELYS